MMAECIWSGRGLGGVTLMHSDGVRLVMGLVVDHDPEQRLQLV